MFTAIDQIVFSDGLKAARVCDVLSVSRSGFYAWRSDVKSNRELKDRELIPMIHEIYWMHRGRCGARRNAVELGRRDVLCGVSRVARLLKTQGLRAIQPKSYTPRTTNSRHTLGYDDNLLAEAATPTALDQVWVGDITYIPIRSGTFGYCAVLMDLYSRRIVGWSYRQTMTEELVIEALSMAIKTRRTGAGLIHHSDRGGQYAGKRYRAMLVRASMSQSMSAAGNCYDNAFMESCFGTIKTELSLEDYAEHADALREIRAYVSYYNVVAFHRSGSPSDGPPSGTTACT